MRRTSVVKRPPVLRALGDREPPPAVVVGGTTYLLETVFKHDSWAATALYKEAGGGQITCKFNRQTPIARLPMTWLGRRLARRETAFLQDLSGLGLAPDCMGDVYVDGVRQDHAVARRFIPGAPLLKGQRVKDEFFPRLFTLLDYMHERGIAYVDLNKKENIVVGEDGRPYLVDFQISFRLPRGRLGRSRFYRALHSQLAEIDRYHVYKHLSHCRPDLATPEELKRATDPPRAIKIYRVPATALRSLRRRILVAMGVRSGSGLSVTETDPEDAVRRSMQSRSGPAE
jgi:hypothetical protein